MPRLEREFLLPVGLVLACLAFFFLIELPLSLRDVGPASASSSFDFQSYFRPRFGLGSHELFQGRLPTWNPYEYGGIPLLATAQPAALYPPKALLFGLLEPVAATWVFLVAHHVLATLGFAWFLRGERIAGPALFAGVALWTFGTALLASSYHPVRIACLSWMPIAFVVCTRLLEKPGAAAFAGLALVVTLQLLAGYPEFTIDLALLLALHAVLKWKQGVIGLPPWKSVPLVAAAFVVAAVAAGLQLLPLAELAHAVRRVDLADKTKGFGPAVLGVDGPVPFLPGFIVLAMVGLFVRRARSAAVGFAVCWVILFGGWRALRYLPVFSMVRFPLAWLFLGTFFFAWVGAFGCDALIHGEEFSPQARRIVAAAVAVISFGFAGLAVSLWLGGSRPGVSGLTATVWRLNFGTGASAAFAVVGGIGLGVLAVRAFAAERSPPSRWFAALASLAASHIAAYPHGAAPAAFAPPAPTGLVARLHGSPEEITGRSLCMQDLQYGYEITDRIPNVFGVELSFLPWRQRQIMSRFSIIPSFAYINWSRTLEARGFLNAMDVEIIVAPTSLIRLLFAAKRMRLVRNDQEFTLFENRDRMGHAWVNYAAYHVPSEAEAIGYVLDRRFDPRAEVVLEEPTRRSYPRTSEHRATAPTREIRTSPVEVEYEVDLPRPGVFVVSEAAYPGWEATVDGAPAPWLRANYVLRAVEVDSGTHRVGFRYRPLSVRWGAAASALGLGAIGLLFAVAWRRRSHAGPLKPGERPS